jgi:cation diffusion facilitator family transporter
MAEESKPAIYAALAGNVLVAATKTFAAVWTGSAAMASEAVHSIVDSGNELFLLYGIKRSSGRPDRDHPLGYGRELYFWSFIVAVLIFGLGAGVSVVEGVDRLRHPEPIENPAVSYVVLGLSLVFESGSMFVAFRQFRRLAGDLGWYQAVRRSKNPPAFMVLLEDGAAITGIFLAAAGTFGSQALDLPQLDGVASILIGLVLAATAGVLARESKSLLIGERADRPLSDSILQLADDGPGVERANGLITVQLAPDQVVAALSVEFADSLRAPDIQASVVDIERRVREAHPEVVALFVKPQTHRTFTEARERRFGSRDDPEDDAQ